MDPVVVFMMFICFACICLAAYIFTCTVKGICEEVAEEFIDTDELNIGY